MFSKTTVVHAAILASGLALGTAPGPALALGGSNSVSPSSSGTAPAPAPTPTPQPSPAPAPSSGPQLADVPACFVAPDIGQEKVCGCAPDRAERSIWGSDPYTADSDICVAARHAGVIGPEGGVVRVIGLPGQDSYAASTANGVASRSWGRYGASFTLQGMAPETATAPAPVPMPTTAPSDAASMAPQCTTLPDGVDRLVCSCQASAEEARQSIWGSDPYTADSAICAAAMHVGYIVAGEPGEVTVLRLQGLDSYWGSGNNGINSQDWGSYSSSFVFDWNQ